jgi:hypothetical protein
MMTIKIMTMTMIMIGMIVTVRDRKDNLYLHTDRYKARTNFNLASIIVRYSSNPMIYNVLVWQEVR